MIKVIYRMDKQEFDIAIVKKDLFESTRVELSMERT